jgi:hypothetical protein
MLISPHRTKSFPAGSLAEGYRSQKNLTEAHEYIGYYQRRTRLILSQPEYKFNTTSVKAIPFMAY